MDLWNVPLSKREEMIRAKLPNVAHVRFHGMISGLWTDATVSFSDGTREHVTLYDDGRVVVSR